MEQNLCWISAKTVASGLAVDKTKENLSKWDQNPERFFFFFKELAQEMKHSFVSRFLKTKYNQNNGYQEMDMVQAE